MNLTIEQCATQIKSGGILAIIRGNFAPDTLLEIGDALLAAPVVAMEVTLNSPNALEAISQLRQRAGDNMLVGAGTVRTVEQSQAAVTAGAQFLVSPGLKLDVVAFAQQQGVLPIPGVFTPTEVEQAVAAGCHLLKLFPADMLGPAYLKALLAPLDDVNFMPTGGISLENIGQYAQAGAAAVGLGSSLIPNAEATMGTIISNARAMQAAWEANHDSHI